MQTVSLHAVVAAVCCVLRNDVGGVFVLANTEQLTYRQFFETVAKVAKRKIHFVSIPFFAMNFISLVGRVLHLKLPFSKENLLGLKGMVIQPSDQSMNALGLKTERFEDLVRTVLDLQRDASS